MYGAPIISGEDRVSEPYSWATFTRGAGANASLPRISLYDTFGSSTLTRQPSKALEKYQTMRERKTTKDMAGLSVRELRDKLNAENKAY